MPRYIDADAFEVDCRKRYCTGCENYNGIKCKSCWVADMLDETENAPTVSPDEVRGVGKWIIRKTAFGKEYTVCSACLTEIKIRKTSGEIVHADTRNARYCMACGAKMEVTSDA